MNGAHDMGGMHGMGPIDTDPDDPLFHAEWERRAFAVTLALGFVGRWNIDTSRHARENRPPLEYLGSSYYELWFKAAEKLALDTGLITAEEAERAIDVTLTAVEGITRHQDDPMEWLRTLGIELTWADEVELAPAG